MRTFPAYTLLLLGALALHSEALAACTVCHSKAPEIVRMHEALEFKGCFLCHRPGALKPPPERDEQMRSDTLCSRCHGETGKKISSPR